MLKHCGRCNTDKPVEDFSKNKRSRDGLCTICKQCSSAYLAEYRESKRDALSEQKKAYYRKNKPRILATNRSYRALNRDKAVAYSRAYYAADTGEHAARNRRWRSRNTDKSRAIESKWRSGNKEKVNAKSARRRAAKFVSTPIWANETAILGFFANAQHESVRTGVKHDVDHIVPITPPLVQSLSLGNLHPKKTFVGPLIPIVYGLHCESNLRVIQASENRAKSNKHWPDMPKIKNL